MPSELQSIPAGADLLNIAILRNDASGERDHMSVFEKGLITILGCTFLFALLAIPLILRRVPRNIVYGFRTRATLSDDFVWFEANAYFGRGLLMASVITAIAALILSLMRGLPSGFFLMASIVALVGPPLVTAFATSRFIRSLTPGGPARRGKSTSMMQRKQK